MKRTVFTVFLFLVSSILVCQEVADESKTLFSFGLNIHRAFIIVHNKEIKPVEDANPIAIQAEFAWQKRDESSWNKCRCFPKMGAAFQFWDFDHPEILGYGLNSYFFIEPEYGASKFFSFSFRGGFGASLLSNPYDEYENPDNQSYSTKLAFALIVSAKAGFRLSDKIRLDIAPYYNHVSNGGVKQPNKGINYPSISAGLTYYPKGLKYNTYNEVEWDKNSAKKRLDISPFLSWKQVDKDVHVFSPGIEVKGSKQIAQINALTLGTEYLEDNFAKYEFEKQNENGNWRKFSVAAGHEFLLGRILFSQQIGLYIYNPDWEGDILYQRYGFVYRFTDFLALGINLKAHRQVADLVDYRIVLSF